MISKEVRLNTSFIERYRSFWTSAKKITEDAIQQTKQRMPLREHAIQLRQVNTPRDAIYNHGHSGLTNESGKEITIRLYPKFRDTQNLLKIELPRSVSHELHHSTRFQLLGYTHGLKEAVIREGLAVHFETEVWGGTPSTWATALDKDQISFYLNKLMDEIRSNNETYEHEKWFYGSSNYPRWTGYALGYYLIAEYLKLHPQETAASLVATPASEILSALKGTVLPAK